MQDCSKTKRIPWEEARRILKSLPIKEEILTSLDRIIKRTTRREVFELDYQYGDLIVDDGRFVAPCGNSECDSCKELLKSTSYSFIPLSFIATESLEIFIHYYQNGERSAPLRIMKAGEVFGVFEVLDSILGVKASKPSWSFSAGSRSIHVIAPLGNRNVPEWIRMIVDRQITWTKDRPEWLLVKESTGPNWTTKIIVLPKEVVEVVKEIKTTDRLFEFLLETGWVQSSSLRNFVTDEATLREVLGSAISKERAPLGELYHYATLQHLLSLSKGTVPSFVSSRTLTEPSGPFGEFCRILSSALKEEFEYEPIVMQPFHIDAGSRGFYSLRCPSMPGPNPADVNTYASVVSSFRNVLDRLTTDPWTALAKNSNFFVKNCKFERYPRIERVENLNPGNLIPGEKSTSKMYFNAPFFVAGVEFGVTESAVHSGKIQRKAIAGLVRAA